LGVIHVIYCIRSSNTAELAKLACSYNMAVRTRAVLSPHQDAPLYTVHDAENTHHKHRMNTQWLSSVVLRKNCTGFRRK